MNSNIESGVYLIGNNIDRKMYIGASGNIKQRLDGNKAKLRANRHHSKSLQEAFNTVGESNFSFITLELTKDYEEREQFWCDYYKANDPNFGYNIRQYTHTNVGNIINITKETREKISIALKGRIPENFSEMQKVRHTPIELYINGTYINSFPSQREAERQTGVNFHAINNQLRGITTNIRGYPNYKFKHKPKL